MLLKQLSLAALLAVAAAMPTQAQQSAPYSWNNLPSAKLPSFKADTVKITQFGAVADGITLNTQSINKAISTCSNKGGGVVLIPQGVWLTGPIELKSNVNLHVARAALVLFTTDKSQYPLVAGDYEGHPSPRNQSPISGTNLQNIAITGDGIFDGNGDVWRAMGKDRVTESEWKALVASGGVVSENGKSWYPSEAFAKASKMKDIIVLKPGSSLDEYAPYKDFFRPNMLVLNNCKQILLQGTTFQNSPAWCLHTMLCQDLTLQGVHVKNPWNAQNGDAIDIESCKNVVVEGSTFDAGDDGICIKSGRDEEGRKRGKATENVLIRNNVVYRAHGGFVIGSEMSGGARNIFVTDCSFIGTDIGLRFKTVRGRGGVCENIYVKNISMKNIIHEAILFDMYYMSKAQSTLVLTDFPAVDEGTPQFKNFYVSNVVCNGAEKAIFVRGLPEMSIKNIYLDNMAFITDKAAEIIEANNISLKNITFAVKDASEILHIENSSKLSFDGIKFINPADLFMSVNGARTADITVLNSNIKNAKYQTEFKFNAPANSVTFKP